ncbi:hypothetical protein C7S20_17180 [Christiangramia fulva]|uniref:histidine kinase n=1 Tax=Christiangramia fulva TaxID=2126553 RepID=A0A2R3Z9J1_9FLAO|nr:PAS domain-containing sensor histidine kinase [Christiangramia fulva]AVR46852.1 hypothetical protein C7S20_17180 [Christiangramia fulva]
MPASSAKLSSITSSELLIITDLDDHKIVYCNDKIRLEQEKNWKNRPCMEDFYENLVHQDDLSDFLKTLKRVKKPASSFGREQVVRFRKNPDSNWEEYVFQHRPYKGHKDQQKNMLLSIAAKNNKKEPKDDDYRQMFNTIDEAFCIFEMIYDCDGKATDYLFLETNPAFEKQIGLGNVVGKTMRELIPDHEDYWFEVYGKVALSGKSVRFQYQAKKTKQRWFDLFALRRGDQNSRQVAVLFRDITEEKMAKLSQKETSEKLQQNILSHQQELQKSKELLQTVFDTTNLGIAVLKAQFDDKGEIKDFLYLRINKVLKDLYKKVDPLGKTFLEVAKFGFRPELFEDFSEVIRSGNDMDKEIHLDRAGKNLWFRITARPHSDLLIVSIEDITGVKLAAQKLVEALRFKKHLVRTTPETIMIVNLNSFSVRYLNKDLFSEEGMTKERIEGTSLPEILPYIHPQDREKITGLHRTLLKSGEEEIHDTEIRLKLDGSTWEWFSVRGSIFQRRDENWVDEYVLLLRNIHQQKKTNQALLKAEKFSIQGEIARTLAHELRNPIASIGMATEVIGHKMEKKQKEDLKNYLDILTRCTKRLNVLVGDLLNSSNYSPTVLRKEDLGKIVEASIEKAADRIYLAGIDLKKNFDGVYSIKADKEKLEIAILNILVNASEATPPEKGKVEITIKSENSSFILIIKDNGIGMKKEEKERLFDAFYTNKKTGTGIGLNSVKNILEEHDAKIEVCSQPKKGSTFMIHFPKIKS